VERRSGLGRGLAALLPSDPEQAPPVEGAAFRELPVGQIDPNPHQPRTVFDEEALVDLTASVRALGVLQPILVRPGSDGRYQLIAGERRWRAARRAGLDVIPAIVRATDDLLSVEQALVENLHRQDLSPLEEAAAYQQLIEDFSLTHDQVAARVSKSRAAITNTLRLLQLPAAVQRLLAEGRVSAGHARALLGLTDRREMERIAGRISDEGLSVRAVEDLVRTAREQVPPSESSPAPRTPPAPLRPPGLLELEEALSELLDTRVGVQLANRRGKVVIEFASLEDLERIYNVMVSGRPS
jgi:ParB family chromosome partitioning protein